MKTSEALVIIKSVCSKYLQYQPINLYRRYSIVDEVERVVSNQSLMQTTNR